MSLIHDGVRFLANLFTHARGFSVSCVPTNAIRRAVFAQAYLWQISWHSEGTIRDSLGVLSV